MRKHVRTGRTGFTALVRNPRTIEALGRVDVLCFDKTGTLTEGKRSVSKVDDGSKVATIGSLAPSQRRVLTTAVRATPDADHLEALVHKTDRAVAEGARADVGPGDGWRTTCRSSRPAAGRESRCS
jgi:P-type E1-E2 ATPase